MCAVGCLIPDDEYQARFDGAGQPGLSGIVTMVTALKGSDSVFLGRLQMAHDRSTTAGHLRGVMRTTACLYGLDDSAIGQITEWEY